MLQSGLFLQMPPAVDTPIPVSVISPNYNPGTALAQCPQGLRSPEHSGGKVCEWIVVDDGSTDGSAGAAGCQIGLDREVRVRDLKHWGLPALLRTDVFDRGVPWTRLILKSRSMRDDLNLRWPQRISVASSSRAGVLRYGRAGRL
jgi:glycosyltransferase involved in cell wall biosynthesis